MDVTSDRLQNSSYEVPRHIVALGKTAVPLLIECITNETKTKRPVFDFWMETRVGDLAFYFLSDLFRDSSLDHHTVDGVITGAEIHREFPGDVSEAAFRQYVTKYGRRHIQHVWEKKWVEIKDKVYWDNTERCFKTRQP